MQALLFPKLSLHLFFGAFVQGGHGLEAVSRARSSLWDCGFPGGVIHGLQIRFAGTPLEIQSALSMNLKRVRCRAGMLPSKPGGLGT